MGYVYQFQSGILMYMKLPLNLGILTLLKIPSAQDGVLTSVNTTYVFAFRYKSVLLLLE